jgi:hypothetical protein
VGFPPRTIRLTRFRLVRDETTLRALLNATDAEGLEFWHKSDWVESWEGVLALLDQYPWHELYPVQVHPDFRGQVWAAVEERWRRRGDDFGRPDRWWWHRLCHVEADPPGEGDADVGEMFFIDENGRSAASFGARQSETRADRIVIFLENARGDSRFCL